MTRNNLDEHLSWLLQNRASIPPVTTLFSPLFGPPLPGNAPVRPEVQNESFVDELDQDEFTAFDLEEEVPYNEQGTEQMPRVRQCPGSETKPPAVRVLNAQDRSPSKYARILPPLQGAGVQRDDAPSFWKDKPHALGRSGDYGTPQDVEVMDLTDCGSPRGKVKAGKFAVTTSAGRKRKSEEFDADNPRAGPRTARSPFVEVEFAAKNGYVKESPARTAKISLSDPPPPYSTVPFKICSTQIKASPQASPSPTRKTQRNARSPFQIMQDSDDDDDIFNLADAAPRTETPAKSVSFAPQPAILRDVPRPVTEQQYASKVQNDRVTPVQRRPSLSREQNPQTPASAVQSSSSEQPEESVWLKRIFAAPASAIQTIRGRLHVRMDILSEEAADRMDAGLDDDPETSMELDDLHQRDTALESLLSKRASYLQLSVRKEELMIALRQAVRSRQPVDEAKAANTKAKNDLQEMENECSSILRKCQRDLQDLLDAPVAEEDSRTLQQIAVQSTQAPATKPEQEEVIPSSGRIVQTQMRAEMPPPNNLPRDYKSSFTVSDFSYPSRPVATRNFASAPAHYSDASTFMDDEINDHDLIDASKEHYSNRMGTPPAPYEDDDFGMGDDDDMWEAAQHIAVPQQNVIQGRQVFSETSGNRQTKPPSATKSKKTTDKLSEDLERRNFSFPWSQDVKRALKERFKLKGFRESQVEAINATLAGKDVFVLMPTGGGKSLCYQLPSLVSSGKTRGVTVVVSPLVSLMEDQVAHLQRLNIQAFLINGDTSSEQRGFIMEKFGDRDVEKFIQLLYVTPEMLGKSQRMLNAFEQLHRNGRLARIVIDEAHCVSQWGHDFRPDYKMLGSVRQKFPGVPVMALTATATDNVRIDTIHNLGMKGCEVFKRSFNRSNLYYEVRTKGKAADDIDAVASLIKDKYRKQTGIVYCLSRKNCETFAKELQGRGIGAHHYHAGLQPEEKSQIQRDWQSGKHQVIVATIAFGMGIDKANVRFVVHHSMPKSLEGYYQETGRAGRDGQPSGCYLFYAYRDVAMLRKMIDQNQDASREQKNRQRQMLTRMELFCANETDCRRVQVLNYFNEPFTRDACQGQCDNCSSNATFNSVDLTTYAQQAVNLVSRATGGGGGHAADDYDGFSQKSSGNVTVNQLVDIFRGSGGKKIKDEWSHVDEFGTGSDLDRGVVERIFHRLLSEDVLRELHVVKGGFPHQYVGLGQLREQYSRGKKFEMQIRVSEAGKNGGKKTSKKNDASKSVGKISGPSRARELPASTNVSSPVQAAAKRTKLMKKANGHQHEAFVASDDETEDDDDGAFEPIRQVGKTPKSNARQLGPPITSDVTMDSLNDVHRALVEQFVEEADAKCKDIMKRKGLRFQPFTTSILRDMAISFTDTEEKMLRIRGIDPEKVKVHGKSFQTMVAKYRDHYNGAMQAEFDSDDDDLNGVVDKHAQNVINLVSDDDDDDADEDEDDEIGGMASEEDDDGEQSSYFQTAPEVAAFNARLSQVQPLGLRTTATSQAAPKPAAKKRKKSNWVAKGSSASSGSRSKARTSNLGDYRFNPESTTQRAPQRRVKSGARVGKASSSRSGSSQHTVGGSRGISMMPT